jgi:hypothetical protein
LVSFYYFLERVHDVLTTPIRYSYRNCNPLCHRIVFFEYNADEED